MIRSHTQAVEMQNACKKVNRSMVWEPGQNRASVLSGAEADLRYAPQSGWSTTSGNIQLLDKIQDLRSQGPMVLLGPRLEHVQVNAVMPDL